MKSTVFLIVLSNRINLQSWGFGNWGCMVGSMGFCLELEGELNAYGYAEIVAICCVQIVSVVMVGFCVSR